MELSKIYQTIQSILQDIAHSPNGMSTGDIVRKYAISRRVVPKYIRILEDAGVPIYIDQKRYYVDEGYYTSFTLNAEESELLALSLQRSLLQYGEHWGAVRSLIHKLASKMAPGTGDNLRVDSDYQGDHTKHQWFTVLARAKRERYQVWVEYHPLNRIEPTRWKIKPYRFFANPFSDGLYVLCDGTQNGHDYIQLSLKFDRILSVELTKDRYDILDLARFANTERQAWGVWSVSQHPIRVVLHFEPRHYDRLIESTWHPSQRISFDNDGIVRFSVEVSNPDEMIPWIRSWGAGVTVQEPPQLRERIIRSLQRQLQAYGLAPHGRIVHTFSDFLWAKYNRKTQSYHRLLYHLLDVAAVAWVMWEDILTYQQRAWISDHLQAQDLDAKRIIAFLVGLHDIGKATPNFQKKAPPIYEQLLATGISDKATLHDFAHGVLSANILEQIFRQAGVNRWTASAMASAIGGHHGTWISYNNQDRAKASRGGEEWQQLQNGLFQQLQATLGLARFGLPFEDTAVCNRFAAVLSGFVSVCDWIGSNEEYFPYQSESVPTDKYWQQALEQARTALREIGWHRWPASPMETSFEEMFGLSPNDFQDKAMQYLDSLTGMPRLVLVEYLTGGGKTELALYLADRLMNRFGLNGTYIAMPTQATSNQMFERVNAYLQSRYPQQELHLQLAHSQAEYHALYQQFQTYSHREGNESGIVAEQWFQNRKRALLAPYAVGTVDQAMLGVLQVQHHFVRLYALSQKVVLFDEIHSYDTYMNTIIERLMEWLTALQSPMILLSATLSSQSRKNLLSHVGAKQESVSDVPYPRLTVVAHDGQVHIYPLPKPVTRTLHLQHIPNDSLTLSDYLADVYLQGGCIAVICNTVDEVIRVAHDLQMHPSIAPDDVWVFHARFPSAWRSGVEQQVLSHFSKHSDRPTRKILVATQVIEQSLDLDFDLVVSSVAPIDLLIQRAGRLHRHERVRPAHLHFPTLVIRAPQFEKEVPTFGIDEAVYDRFVLLKTWLLLDGKSAISIPDDLDAMMDFVYSREYPQEFSDAMVSALEEAYSEMTLADRRSVIQSTVHLIAPPQDELLIGGFNEQLVDDDDHGITTRDIRPGVDIICMSTDKGSGLPYPIERKPTRDEIKHLLQYRLNIQRTDLVKAIKALPLNPHWEHVPALRYARVIHFTNGEAIIPNSGYRLKLTPTYGLEIIKE